MSEESGDQKSVGRKTADSSDWHFRESVFIDEHRAAGAGGSSQRLNSDFEFQIHSVLT
jgi:hypothetical protein